jgi:hypothetical protein
MTKHTQGPWSIGMRNGANSNLVYANDGADLHHDTPICSVYGMYQHCNLHRQKDDTGLANARLIAAAPELLEALIHAKNMLESVSLELTLSYRDPSLRLIKIIRNSNLAIAKAEGQS